MDFAKLFLWFAASERSSAVFSGVYCHRFAAFHRRLKLLSGKKAAYILNLTRNIYEGGSVALENEVGKVSKRSSEQATG